MLLAAPLHPRFAMTRSRQRFPRPGGVAALLVFLACGIVGCDAEPPSGEEAPDRAGDPTPASTPATPEESEAVARKARPVATALMTTLSGRLQEAMAERGTAGALEFCNVEALPLTRRVAEEQGMEVTRTSLRLRNPANAADAVDAEALTWFQERIAAGGELPPRHVRKVAGDGYRYYQPLVTGEACLQCHGPRASLAADVLRALEERYPEDEAVGYAEGDWRGLLRVSVPDAGVTTP